MGWHAEEVAKLQVQKSRVSLGSAVSTKKPRHDAPSMLEYFTKEKKRTLVDFRRGPLGQHFDDFAAHLKAKRITPFAVGVLGKCCQFQCLLIERRISSVAQLRMISSTRSLKPIHAQSRATGSKNTRPRLTRASQFSICLINLIEAKSSRHPNQNR